MGLCSMSYPYILAEIGIVIISYLCYSGNLGTSNLFNSILDSYNLVKLELLRLNADTMQPVLTPLMHSFTNDNVINSWFSGSFFTYNLYNVCMLILPVHFSQITVSISDK